MIFARKTTWRRRLDLEYLDETSSRKISARQRYDNGPKRTRPLRQFADYASKETLGQVHAGGFHAAFAFPERRRNIVSFHRFQIVVWTLVLGIVFVSGVITKLAMPNFDQTLLLLMGISSGTYLGFKLPGGSKP